MMNWVTASRLVSYLRRMKSEDAVVFSKYDKELGRWSVIIGSGATGEIYQFFSVTRKTVRAMSVLAQSAENW